EARSEGIHDKAPRPAQLQLHGRHLLGEGSLPLRRFAVSATPKTVTDRVRISTGGTWPGRVGPIEDRLQWTRVLPSVGRAGGMADTRSDEACPRRAYEARDAATEGGQTGTSHLHNSRSPNCFQSARPGYGD